MDLSEDPILFSIAELYHKQFIVLAMEELERHNPDWEGCNRVTVLELMVVNSLKLMVITFQGYKSYRLVRQILSTDGYEFLKTNG